MDRIVAKRFNPRRRINEYLVKWINPSVPNTWETTANLENVAHVVDTFEKQLARQKENRAAIEAKQLNNQNANAISGGNTSIVDSKTTVTNAVGGNNNNRTITGGISSRITIGGSGGGVNTNMNSGKLTNKILPFLIILILYITY